MIAVVYFVQAGDGGPIKIGFTANMPRRLESLQNGNAVALQVLHVVECGARDAARELEARLHAQFAAARRRSSEWFDCHAELLAEIDRLRAAPPPVQTRSLSRTTVTEATTLRWNRPLCSFCEQPIDDIKRAYAAWHVVRNAPADHCFADPVVMHQGGRCSITADRFLDDRDISRMLNDLPVEWLRRAPLDAIGIATRWHGDEYDRLAWVSWVAVVLGLPANAWNCLSALQVNDEVADVVIDRVYRAEDLRARRRR